MRSLIVAILATGAPAAESYQVINDGESVEVHTVPETPPEPGEPFFKPAPSPVIPASAGVAELVRLVWESVKPEGKLRVLERLAAAKPRTGADLRALLDLHERGGPSVAPAVSASLGRLGPRDSALSPFFEALLGDEEPSLQLFGLAGAARIGSLAARERIRELARAPFQAEESTLSLSPTDSARWRLTYHALAAWADWEGEKALPFLLKRSKDVPAVAALAAERFWAQGLADFVAWSESSRAQDQARARRAWSAGTPAAALAATRAELWELLLSRRKPETRHRAAVKLGICAEDADVDRLLAGRAEASGFDRKLLDAALFASRSPKAVPALLEYAKESPDPLARAGARLQLRDLMPPARYRSLLLWAAEKDPDPENRRAAAAELSSPPDLIDRAQ